MGGDGKKLAGWLVSWLNLYLNGFYKSRAYISFFLGGRE